MKGFATYVPGFIPAEEAGLLFTRLMETLPLKRKTVHLYGKTMEMPRLMSWHGSGAYTFGGATHPADPLTPELQALRDRLSAREGVDFNSVLVNVYRNGSDSVAYHADDEPELGDASGDIRIASISLGETRRFLLRGPEGTRRFDLDSGSLLVMGGDLQATHRHAVPKTKRIVGARMNLTFRVRKGEP